MAQDDIFSNDSIIWKFFKTRGLNDYAIAGIMGNLYAESGLSPINLQNSYEKKLGFTDRSYTDQVDDGTYDNFIHDSAGYGLVQWTHWSRKEKLLKYAKSTKKSIGDLQMQLEFLWNELRPYPGFAESIEKADTIQAASDYILTKYEKPADQSDAVKMKRAEYGKNFYNKFASSDKPPFQEYKVKLTTSALNVRKGPGTNYPVINCIRDRGIYTITEESSGTGAKSWGKLKYGIGQIDHPSWIALDYTSRV